LVATAECTVLLFVMFSHAAQASVDALDSKQSGYMQAAAIKAQQMLQNMKR
jgi:hypothetical protein